MDRSRCIRLLGLVLLISMATSCSQNFFGESANPHTPAGMIEYIASDDGNGGREVRVEVTGSPDQLRLETVEIEIVSDQDLGYAANMESVEVREDTAVFVLRTAEVTNAKRAVGATPWHHTITLITRDGLAFAAAATLSLEAENPETNRAELEFEVVDVPLTD